MSQEVAEQALFEIRRDVDERDGSGMLSDSELFDSAAEAWQRNGVGDLFPGNLLTFLPGSPAFDVEEATDAVGQTLTDIFDDGIPSFEEIKDLLSSGVSAALIVTGLSAGAIYGKRRSDYAGLPQFTNQITPDGNLYAIIDENTNKIVAIEDRTGFSSTLDEILLELLSPFIPGNLFASTIALFGDDFRRTLTESSDPNAFDGDINPVAPPRVFNPKQNNISDEATSGNDTLWGTDSLLSFGGNDSISGGSGNDVIFGAGGEDSLSGDTGEDILWGQEGSDNLSGGTNNDVLRGGESDDRLDGGDGSDILDGGDITLPGEDDGDDTLNGDGGDDVLLGGSGDDVLDGGDGDLDTAYYSGSVDEYDFSISDDGEVVTITHARGSREDGQDTLQNVEFGQFADELVPLSGIDLVFVIDATSSMSDDIAAVKQQARQIIEETIEEVPLARFAIVTYRDPGQTQTNLTFTTDVDEAVAGINSISVSGGGDFPEGVNSGLLHALRNEDGLGQWRQSPTPRAIFLVGDAPAKDTELRDDVNTIAIQEFIEIDENITPEPFTFTSSLFTSRIKAQDYDIVLNTPVSRTVPAEPVRVFPIAIGQSGTSGFNRTLADFQDVADATGGEVFTAADASDVVPALLEAIDTVIDDVEMPPDNNPPALENDITTTPIGTAITIDVLANDSDADGDALTITQVSDLTGGTASIVNNQVRFVPTLFFVGTASFSYTATDDEVEVSASVTIDVQIPDNAISGSGNLNGTGADEVIVGDDSNNNINTNGGADIVLGRGGDDIINGSNSADQISGGAGNDQINGNGGADIIFGGAGNDRINGSASSEFIDGGAGNDEINANGGADNILGGEGDDIIRTGSGNDLINSGTGNDLVQLNGGQDIVTLQEGDGFDRIENFQLGNTTFDIDVDVSSLSFSSSNGGVEILLNGDVLAFVTNSQVSTFQDNLNTIFV
ncbi:MAG: Ig-like domain-containing protein [Synechococcales bacterium]|nr:Ig-like domain-containing protein [Synechococcales bacterium]